MTTDPKLVDVAKAAGVSYRQADYWVRHHYVESYLAPHDHAFTISGVQRRALPGKNAGSGYVRHLTPDEAHIFHLLAALVDMGMNAAPAAPLARQLAETPHIPVVRGSVAISVID